MGADEQTPGALDPTSAFVLLGGEPSVRALVDTFYDHMDSDQRFAGIRAMHPATLAGSRAKLFWFLCGWLGGPPHYEGRFGHPRLRARHLPFAIGIAERDQWLLCMAEALAERGIEGALFDRLLGAFHSTADWMRNRAN